MNMNKFKYKKNRSRKRCSVYLREQDVKLPVENIDECSKNLSNYATVYYYLMPLEEFSVVRRIREKPML